MSSNDIVLRVENLSKCFEIYEKPIHRLMQTLCAGKKQYYKEFWALRDINFEMLRGECVGIIGRNGAGKSTLLKAILGENEYSGSLTFVDGNDKMSRRPIIGYVPQKLDFDYSSPVSVLDVFACTQSNRPVYFSHDKKVKDIALRSLRKVQGENLINAILNGKEYN